MAHVPEHCATPKPTRHWKRLGYGAMWSCTCGKVFRLTCVGAAYGSFWTWESAD